MERLQDIIKVDIGAKTRYFKKKEILQRKGDTKPKTLYVKKGLLRSYIIDSKGKEHIYMFAPEGWIIADVESLEIDAPVELYIDCLEDSEVIIFDKNTLFNEEQDKEALVQNAHLLYRRMGVLQRRVLMLMSSPAVDRYNYFIQAYPELPNRVPQHMIATYLGITPQALSTIRGKIANAK